MKWIKFDDMKPAIGMNIFLFDTRGRLTLEDWTKEQSYYSHDFEFWAPLSFFEEHLPQEQLVDSEYDLKRDQNWYLQNEGHENINKIKQITEDLQEKTKHQLEEMVKVEFGFMSYRYLKHEEIDLLFEQINHPDREKERIQNEIAREEYLKNPPPFDKALLSVQVPNLISKIKHIKQKSPSCIINLKTYHNVVYKEYKNKNTGKIIRDYQQVIVSQKDDWELI